MACRGGETEIVTRVPVGQMQPPPRMVWEPAPMVSGGLEQRIGTRWVLIAGVITVMFAVGFFLKYISILWAVYATALMVAGFWRRVRTLRYLALGIFVLPLAKISLIDTRHLDTAYRIAGFLVTGLALVGVSYLYQYLKKTGFFDAVLEEKDKRDRE